MRSSQAAQNSLLVNVDKRMARNNADTRPAVLIPAFEPDRTLLILVGDLLAARIAAAIIVVDDGSSLGSRHIFDQLRELSRVDVLRHDRNLGKGAALKTGLHHAAAHYPDSLGVVTADADGQHAFADIVRVAHQFTRHPKDVVIGAREMNRSAPLRSRFGNGLTRWTMRVVAGQTLSDTQTGLRGIPMGYVPELLRIPSTHYDFEMDMLIRAREAGLGIREVPIQTVYLDDNRGSHFKPVRDSMRVYAVFLRFCGVSLMTSALDNIVFVIAMQFWPWIGLCQAISRISAGSFQFWAGRRGVFRSRAPVAQAMLRYWMLVAATGGISYLIIQAFLTEQPFKSVFGPVSAKITAETLLFFGNFAMQRTFVFRSHKTVRAES